MFSFLLADSTGLARADAVAGHKDIVWLEVSVDDLVLVQVLEGVRYAERAQDALPAVRVARDDPRDEVRQRAVRDELCHSAVVVLRDKSPVELYRVRRVDLLEDVGLFVEIGNRILVHVAEL